VRKSRNNHTISFTGISIVNGAQTTGAIGNLGSAPDENLFVPIRFIKTTDENIIYDIIKFNNSQNKISASDFRSTDLVQRRLKKEFETVPDTEYEAGRAGEQATLFDAARISCLRIPLGKHLLRFTGTQYSHTTKNRKYGSTIAVMVNFLMTKLQADTLYFLIPS
jgi:AIPR protein